MVFYLSIKDKKGKFVRYKVPSAIYHYVNLLEDTIRYPDFTALIDEYPDRFAIMKSKYRGDNAKDNTTNTFEDLALLRENTRNRIMARIKSFKQLYNSQEKGAQDD